LLNEYRDIAIFSLWPSDAMENYAPAFVHGLNVCRKPRDAGGVSICSDFLFGSGDGLVGWYCAKV
jgi:hypothetical protein